MNCHDSDPDDRFGIPEQVIEATIKAHRGVIRMGVYVPTRVEVATWPCEKLKEALSDWMYESPSELIPSDMQIAEVLAILEARQDADEMRGLIAECRGYINS